VISDEKEVEEEEDEEEEEAREEGGRVLLLVKEKLPNLPAILPQSVVIVHG